MNPGGADPIEPDTPGHGVITVGITVGRGVVGKAPAPAQNPTVPAAPVVAVG